MTSTAKPATPPPAVKKLKLWVVTDPQNNVDRLVRAASGVAAMRALQPKFSARIAKAEDVALIGSENIITT